MADHPTIGILSSEHRRRMYYVPGVDPDCPEGADYENPANELKEPHEMLPPANVVGSLSGDGSHHLPCIDVDVPAKLVPSSTPGHHHLYIDVPLAWHDYCDLLDVMARCGIVEEGYVSAAKARGQTSCRLPHVRKEGGPVTIHMTSPPPPAVIPVAVRQCPRCGL